MNRVTIIIFLALFFHQGFGQAKKADYKDILPIIDLWLDGQKDFDRLPGISVSIVQDQELLFSKGYGYADVEKKIPMTAETICSICSISKLFTSVAVMQLWEKGMLRLDDSLKALLPPFNMKQQYAETMPITVRSLLTHSSGLPRESDYPYWSSPKFYFPTVDEMNNKLVDQQTLYPSSTYFQYSNLGMSLLGEIVSAKTSKTYSDYIEDNILKPLQLSNTHPYLPENLWRGKMATGYSALNREGVRTMLPLFKTNAIAPAAGFSSNVNDMAKFASWQMRLLSKNTNEVLRSSTLKEMQRIQWISPDKKLTWGLGFILHDNNGTTYLGHDGSCPGYRTVLMMDPRKKIAISIMINAQGVSPYKYCDAIFDLINKSIIEDTTIKNINLKIYSGRYDNYAWSGEIMITPYKGKLVMLGLPADNPAENISVFQYIEGDRFRRIRPDDNSLAEELRFEKDKNGSITRMWLNSNFRDKIQ
ncbi:MAG: serine hydrolase domain-containing protein [Chitinophagaceae bacterium]